MSSDKLSLAQSDSNSIADGLNTSTTVRQKVNSAASGAQKDVDSVGSGTVRPAGKEGDERDVNLANLSVKATDSASSSFLTNDTSSNGGGEPAKRLPESGSAVQFQLPNAASASMRLRDQAASLQSANVVVRSAKRGSAAINAHLIKLEEQSSLRSQIASAVDRVDAGLPSAIAVAQNGTIAVGTSHGVVLVFDATQVLRFCVGNRNVGSEYGGVSCLGFNRDSTRLLVGYAKGQVRSNFTTS